MGRRIRKWGTGLIEQRFIYDGWNLIAETDSVGTLTRRYVWGLDASGTLQGAGGVGGLLLIQDGSVTYYPIYDASRNVIGLYDSAGAVNSAYEYDPFGKLQVQAGSFAAANPFRFSTKYTDNETGFTYYGHRYYSSTLGRFINRDPIAEAGGVNLYGLCGNDGVNRWDYLGMDAQSDKQKQEEEERRKREEERIRQEKANAAQTGAQFREYGLAGVAFGMNNENTLQAWQNGYNSGPFSGSFTLTAIDKQTGEVRGAREVKVQGSYGAVMTTLGVANSLNAPNNIGEKFYIVSKVDGKLTATPATLADIRTYATGRSVVNVFENGQSNNLKKAMNLGSEQLGADSFVLHWNPTQGGFIDTLESVWGKLTGSTRAGRELGNFLSANTDLNINLVAHSQGGISANIGITQVINELGMNSLPNLSVHYNGAAVEQIASQNLLAQAGARFNGFSMNPGDPIPVLAGGNYSNVAQVLQAIWRMPATIAGENYGSTHTHYGPFKP